VPRPVISSVLCRPPPHDHGRTLAWLNRNRRLAKDFEVTTKALAWLMIASVKLLSRRLARA
jgi:hypothetical protein